MIFPDHIGTEYCTLYSGEKFGEEYLINLVNAIINNRKMFNSLKVDLNKFGYEIKQIDETVEKRKHKLNKLENDKQNKL